MLKMIFDVSEAKKTNKNTLVLREYKCFQSQCVVRAPAIMWISKYSKNQNIKANIIFMAR